MLRARFDVQISRSDPVVVERDLDCDEASYIAVTIVSCCCSLLLFLSYSCPCCWRAMGARGYSAAVSPKGPRAGRLPTPPAAGCSVWFRYWGLGRLWLGNVKSHIVGYLGRTPIAWTWMQSLAIWATMPSM